MNNEAPALYRINAVAYDGPLRMQVPSRRKGVAPYLVQLDAYNGNSICQCKHFVTRLEPLLRRGISRKQALEEGRAKVPVWGTVEDLYRCWHIHVARLKFADDIIAAISAAQKQHGTTKGNDDGSR